VPKIYLASLGDAALAFNTSFAAKLRHAGISAAIDYDAKSMKSQMRAADRMKAEYVIVIGDSELEAQSAKLKHMSDGREIEVKLSLDGVLAALAADAETK
jgi:histidyl-tRNA synthetase